MKNVQTSENNNHCPGCGNPIANCPPSLSDALSSDDGSVYFRDGGGMDSKSFQDLRARALTLASILEDEDVVTADHFFLSSEWDDIGENYGHLMERGLAFMADLYLIPFIHIQDENTGANEYVFIELDEDTDAP